MAIVQLRTDKCVPFRSRVAHLFGPLDGCGYNVRLCACACAQDQGWFDQWGVAQRVRYPRDQLYGIARFVAHGGSWHSFYMRAPRAL